MATVTIETKQVMVPSEVEVVALEMSVEEAATLALILDFVGGHDQLSARKYADSVRRALNAQGIRVRCGDDHLLKDSGLQGIYFSNLTKDAVETYKLP